MKMHSNLLENYELTTKLIPYAFTENCRKGCVHFEESIDKEFIYCGSPKWEKDDLGNMVDFVEEKHCDFKAEEITECPICHEELILRGKDWGFCDNCCCEITNDD